MPALEALVEKFHGLNVQPIGVSVDSVFCHGAWANSLGGISFPLLSDFEPKGALAKSLGLYLDGPGITDRATVLIDASGVVKHVSSVGPPVQRDMNELFAMCKKELAGYSGEATPPAKPKGLQSDAVLYVREPCTFSEWTLAARNNLHLDVAVKNVTKNASAKAELEALGGKAQAPALKLGDKVLYESAEIIGHLVKTCATL